MIENVLLFLYLVILLPKFFLDRLKGKRHPAFLQRLGFHFPKPTLPVIWIHAVSVGEVKAAAPLFKALYSKEKFFLITTTTATGQEEAKRTLKGADHYAYLPLDFTWVATRVVKKINPIHFILIESDFWPNLLSALKKNGTKLSLVNAKLSLKSHKRFKIFKKFSKRLFGYFDAICVQNQEHYLRFLPFIDPKRLHVTGNLKLDIVPEKVQKKLELKQPVITISCTHAPEEEKLLEVLEGGEWTLLLAPRHPERFEEVAKLLKNKNILFGRLSKNEMCKVVLVDAMGQLPICYTHSRLAILGGSFIDKVGGHNVIEPCLYGCPVFFGPFMHAQLELANRVIETNGGMQISLNQLRDSVDQFFNDPSFEQMLRQGALNCLSSGNMATKQSLQIIF